MPWSFWYFAFCPPVLAVLMMPSRFLKCPCQFWKFLIMPPPCFLSFVSLSLSRFLLFSILFFFCILLPASFFACFSISLACLPVWHDSLVYLGPSVSVFWPAQPASQAKPALYLSAGRRPLFFYLINGSIYLLIGRTCCNIHRLPHHKAFYFRINLHVERRPCMHCPLTHSPPS